MYERVRKNKRALCSFGCARVSGIYRRCVPCIVSLARQSRSVKPSLPATVAHDGHSDKTRVVYIVHSAWGGELWRYPLKRQMTRAHVIHTTGEREKLLLHAKRGNAHTRGGDVREAKHARTRTRFRVLTSRSPYHHLYVVLTLLSWRVVLTYSSGYVMQISTTPEIPPASTALPLWFGFRCAGGPILLLCLRESWLVCARRFLLSRELCFACAVRCAGSSASVPFESEAQKMR